MRKLAISSPKWIENGKRNLIHYTPQQNAPNNWILNKLNLLILDRLEMIGITLEYLLKIRICGLISMILNDWDRQFKGDRSLTRHTIQLQTARLVTIFFNSYLNRDTRSCISNDEGAFWKQFVPKETPKRRINLFLWQIARGSQDNKHVWHFLDSDGFAADCDSRETLIVGKLLRARGRHGRHFLMRGHLSCVRQFFPVSLG